MTEVFADAFFYLAILNSRDRAHAKTYYHSIQASTRFVTTSLVLTEVLDGLSAARQRARAAALIRQVSNSPNTQVVTLDDDLWNRTLRLYESRGDKNWSFTDCASFVVMTDLGLDDALTGDRHFEQAGFRALLKPS